jgi:hypothetical protein
MNLANLCKQSAIVWHNMRNSARRPVSAMLHHHKCSAKLKYKLGIRHSYIDFEARHYKLYEHFLGKHPSEFWKT